MAAKVLNQAAGLETVRRSSKGSGLKRFKKEVSLKSLRALQHLSPSTVARIADELFFTPPRFDAPEAEKATLATGHRFTIPYRDGRLHAWSWPVEQAGPTVLLVHGWGGRGGQMSTFVQPLLNAGFSVVLFDQPGHGLSAIPELKGQTSLREFSLAVDAVARHVGELGQGVNAIIGHSMGGSAAIFAASRGLKVGKLVTIATPISPFRYFDLFVKELGLTPPAIDLMRERAENRIGLRWFGLDVTRFLRTLASERASEVGLVKGLVVHDTDDQDTPVSDAFSIAQAWKESEIMITKNLGHRRILKDATVIERVIGFLTS